MFVRRLSPKIQNLIINNNKTNIVRSSISSNRSAKSILRRYYATYLRSTNEELNPFDYDRLPSDFDDDIYKELLKQDDPFNVNRLVNINELFEHRCHLGHKTGSLNDFMKPYLFGHRQDITIFDLNQTAQHLKLALNFAAHIAFRNGIILFVNPSRETAHLVERAALDCGEYSQCREFKDRSFLDPEMFFKTPICMPSLMIIFKTKKSNFEQHKAISVFARLLVPSIGIVDSDCDPRLITYPIPANDDTHSSIELFARLFKEAILLGKQKRKELIKNRKAQPKQTGKTPTKSTTTNNDDE